MTSISIQRLITEVRSWIIQLKALPPNPTHEQLEKKVHALATTIRRGASSAPLRIKEIITEGFLSFGWNIASMSVSNQALLTTHGFINGLLTIAEDLENWSPVVTPTEDELQSLSLACSRLWDLDVHRLAPEHDYAINLQQGKRAYEEGDFASDPLFTHVTDDLFERPTFKAFIDLFDNYHADIGMPSVIFPIYTWL